MVRDTSDFLNLDSAMDFQKQDFTHPSFHGSDELVDIARVDLQVDERGNGTFRKISTTNSYRRLELDFDLAADICTVTNKSLANYTAEEKCDGPVDPTIFTSAIAFKDHSATSSSGSTSIPPRRTGTVIATLIFLLLMCRGALYLAPGIAK